MADKFDITNINKDLTSMSEVLQKTSQEQLSSLSKMIKETPDAKLDIQEKIKEEEIPEFLKQTFCGEKDMPEGKVKQEATGQRDAKLEAKQETSQVSAKQVNAQQTTQKAASAEAPQMLELPKMPEPARIPTLQEAAQKFDKDVTVLLAREGIPLTDENKETAKMMLVFKAQVEKEQMQRLTSTLAQVPDAGKEEKQSAVFLHANNQTVTKENVESVASYIKENSQIANKFTEIQNTFVQIAAESQNPQAVKIFARLSEALGWYIAKPDAQTTQEMKVTFFKLAQVMGIEKDLNQVVFRQINMETGVKIDSKNMETIYQQLDIGKLANAISSIAEKLPISAAEKALLIKVVDMVSQLSQNISGARLINEAGISRASEGSTGFYCMNVPMRFGEEVSNGKLIISFQPYGNVDPENVKIDFRVETKKLGFMQFMVNIVNNMIQGNIYVESEKVKDMVEKNIVSFKKALLAQLYQIKYIACDIIEEGKVKFLSELNFDNIEVLTA